MEYVWVSADKDNYCRGTMQRAISVLCKCGTGNVSEMVRDGSRCYCRSLTGSDIWPIK